MESEGKVGRKPTAEKVAEQLAEIHRMPVCEDCEVLRGANLYAKKHFGHKLRGSKRTCPALLPRMSISVARPALSRK